MSIYEFAILAFTSFFTLINPLGVMPIFLSLSSDLDSKMRKKVAIKSVSIAFFVLVFFAFTGQLLFKFFSIGVDSFRIVGGVIFFTMGYDMLQAKLGRTKEVNLDMKKINDFSITPLAIPMICGPGAITNSIVLMEDASNITFKIVLIFIMFLVSLITLILLLAGSKIINLLGETGNTVLMRLMGLIVMVISIEFFLSGLIPIIEKINF